VTLPEPPRNGGYMIAGYSITALILLCYWLALWRRARRSVRLAPPRSHSGQ
jgi:hypothetical protein